MIEVDLFAGHKLRGFGGNLAAFPVKSKLGVFLKELGHILVELAPLFIISYATIDTIVTQMFYSFLGNVNDHKMWHVVALNHVYTHTFIVYG